MFAGVTTLGAVGAPVPLSFCEKKTAEATIAMAMATKARVQIRIGLMPLPPEPRVPARSKPLLAPRFVGRCPPAELLPFCVGPPLEELDLFLRLDAMASSRCGRRPRDGAGAQLGLTDGVALAGIDGESEGE